MLELYYSTWSINSEKVLLCLFEKGVNFKGHHVDLFKFEQTEPKYLAVNPNGLVPTLVAHGHPICESTAINEYLDDAWEARSLRPASFLTRAQVRAWVIQFQDMFYPALALLSQVHFMAAELKRRWSADQLNQMISRKPLPDRRARQLRAIEGGYLPSDIANAEANVAFILDRMETLLRKHGGEWLEGAFSLADVGAAPNVHRLHLLGRHEFLRERPLVSAWYERLRRRPSFVQTYNYAPSGSSFEQAKP